MQIETFVDFLLYTLFTFAIVFIGLPFGATLSIVGARCAKTYGMGKLPEGVVDPRLGKSAPQLLFAGALTLTLAIWYLFFDRGGNLINWFHEAGEYLGVS